jgi:hypothetical protein
MLSSQEEQAERARVMRNDARVKEEQGGSTYLDHVEQPAGGRFAVIDQPTIVGAELTTNYPAASAAHQTELPPEPPLHYARAPTAPSSTIPLLDDVERVGSPLSSKLDRRF